MKNRTKQSTLFKFLNLFSKSTIFVFFVALFSSHLFAQQEMQIMPGAVITCPMSNTDAHSRHGMDFDTETLLQKEPTAEFIIQFGNGFENNPEAREAFEFATEIWSREIVSAVPIRVAVQFDVFFGNVTASANATYTVSDFPGVPVPSLLYSGALANAISGRVLQPNAASEINITYGEQVDFYFGIDGNTPSKQIDFVSTSLHEIAHGLGFNASSNAENNIGSFTDFTEEPLLFTNFLTNNDQVQALELRSSGVELSSFLTSDAVFFSGENATAANSNAHPPVHAPTNFAIGSSISHWDEDTYPTGDPNSLMTPVRNASESIFNIGDITRGLLKDLGWELSNSKLFPLKIGEVEGDLEILVNNTARQTFTLKNSSNKPLTYSASIEAGSNANLTVSNAENVALQPNEETVIEVVFNANEAVTGEIVKANILITNSLSEFVTKKELNFVVLGGEEVAVIDTIETLNQNFAVVNEFNGSFRINNPGDRLLDYTISIENDEVAILEIDEPNGRVLPNDFSIVKYTLNREGIEAGTYTSEIVISSNANNAPNLRIPVTVIVRDTLNPPAFNISIDRSLEVEVEVDSSTDLDEATVTFEIENSGESPLEFNLLGSETDLVRTVISLPGSNVLAPGAKVNRTITITPGINAVDTELLSEIVFTSNDPSLSELRIPLNISISKQRGRFEVASNLFSTLNIVEEGSSANNIVQLVNTGLSPITITDVASETSGIAILDWSSASGDAIVEVGETVTIKTRSQSIRRPSTGILANSIRIVSDATPNEFFNNIYSSPLNVIEASGILASELLLTEEINTNSTIDTGNLVRSQTVQITNVENVSIPYSVVIEGNENGIFSVDSTSGVLAPNETKEIEVTFDATGLEQREFNSQIVISATGSLTEQTTINANLRLINQQGSLEQDPFSSFVDFFDNFVSGSVAFKNNSRIPVEVTNIAFDSNVPFQELFAFSDSGGEFPGELLVVNPGEFVFVDYFYIPTTTDQNNIIVTSNASNSQLLIPLEIEFPEDLEPQVLGYQLIDVVTNEVVETFFEGATVDLADYNNPVTLVAFSGAATPGSVVFDYGETSGFRIDNTAPFSLGRNFRDQLLPFNFTLGEQSITATPFSDTNGEGQEFIGATFNFNFIDSRLPFITDFVLVNAETNEVIRPIEEGETLDLNSFDTRSFNIVALLDKPSKSVTFNSNGKRRFDLFAPFSLGGDFKGNFGSLKINEGENKITAFSNSFVRRRGLVSGNPRTINFTVIPLEPSETIGNNSLFTPFLVTPNPVLRDADFKVAVNSASSFQIKLNNLLNQPINASKRVTIDEEGNGLLNLSGLISGYYFLTITDASNGKIFKAKILKR